MTTRGKGRFTFSLLGVSHENKDLTYSYARKNRMTRVGFAVGEERSYPVKVPFDYKGHC